MPESLRESATNTHNESGQELISNVNASAKVCLEYPQAISDAASRIAPAWPLDTAIAVNPWWQMRDLPFSDVAAHLASLRNVKCLMPKSFYRKHWQRNILPQHLMIAAKQQNITLNESDLLSFIHNDNSEALPCFHSVSDLLDMRPEQAKKLAWHDEIVQQISQLCGLAFQYSAHVNPAAQAVQQDTTQGAEVDKASALNQTSAKSPALYKTWLDVARRDKGIEVLMGESGLHTHIMNLPECPKQLCEKVMQEFGDPDNFSEYAHALLIDVHGWASFMAYKAWQDNFVSTQNDLVEQLVSIRLAWDYVLFKQLQQSNFALFDTLSTRFYKQFKQAPVLKEQHAEHQGLLWVWQNALEMSYQCGLHQQLKNSKQILTSSSKQKQPILQAAFCIDVRSEPMRRALEAQHKDIETIGFAGFFGLPIEYSIENKGQKSSCQNNRKDSTSAAFKRGQLPGLLAPAINVSQSSRSPISVKYSNSSKFNERQKSAFDAPPASLGLVEMLGVFKAYDLLKQSLWPSAPKHAINHLCDNESFELFQDGNPIAHSDKTDLVFNILTKLGLSSNFAPTVLLLGHGSCTANNPQAATLDCGACGGQSGEVNVKVLAQLLNSTAIRQDLKNKGITIPDSTRFIAGLHNTTSDEITCYQARAEAISEVEPTLLPEIEKYLHNATNMAQKKRAKSVGLSQSSLKLALDYQKLSRDWAQVRPEWGLANNAAFIVAPRSLTRDIDLEGRSFLHDYDWQADKDFETLELIMTAPMIVTNWINLQYYASVSDNQLYGSGNKLLHNVVGEHLGVFEGNGGDLRIGLSMQSLHDGVNWRHMPLRLSVYIDAPREAIERIVKKHAAVAQLIDNDWLYLFQLGEKNNEQGSVVPNNASPSLSIHKYYRSQWTDIELTLQN